MRLWFGGVQGTPSLPNPQPCQELFVRLGLVEKLEVVEKTLRSREERCILNLSQQGRILVCSLRQDAG